LIIRALEKMSKQCLSDILNDLHTRISLLEARAPRGASVYSHGRAFEHVRDRQTAQRSTARITPEIKLEFFLDKILQYRHDNTFGWDGTTFGEIVQRFRTCPAYRNSRQSTVDKIFQVPQFSEDIQRVWDASLSNPVPVSTGRLLDTIGNLAMISEDT